MEKPMSVGSVLAAARYVDIDGIRTRYFDLGDGPPLLLWHGDEFGGVGSASTWSLNLEGLSRRFRVIAADRLGQGFTDVSPEADYSVDAVLQHMNGFIRAMRLQDVHVVGQSRGAYFATRLTLDNPDLVRSLVVVDTATLAPEAGSTQERLTHLLAGAPSDLREYARFRWTRLSYSTDHLTDDYLDEVAEMARGAPAQQVRPAIEHYMKTTFLPSLARQKEETLARIAEGRIKCPTLLVWGVDDPLAPLPSGLELFNMICKAGTSAQMHIFNQAGHFPYREHPLEFNSLLVSFLGDRP
jgi:2-hydroxy-6-oxonona-2,4-dienedioate hydrolase